MIFVIFNKLNYMAKVTSSFSLLEYDRMLHLQLLFLRFKNPCLFKFRISVNFRA